MTNHKLVRLLLVSITTFFPAAAPAGNQFCNDDVPYYLEEIPFGYAIVRGAWANYCKRIFFRVETHEQDTFFTCDGRDDYRVMFHESGEDIVLGPTVSEGTRFYPCRMNHDTTIR